MYTAMSSHYLSQQEVFFYDEETVYFLFKRGSDYFNCKKEIIFIVIILLFCKSLYSLIIKYTCVASKSVCTVVGLGRAGEG